MDPNFNITFAEDGSKAEISDLEWAGGWAAIVGGINGIPTAQQFNTFGYLMEQKSNIAKGIADNAWGASQEAMTEANQATSLAETANNNADDAKTQVAGAVAAAALAQSMASNANDDADAAQARADSAYGYAAANYLLIVTLQNTIAIHESRIKTLEDALFNDIIGNPFSVLFNNLNDVTVEGVWNVALQRIEC